MDKIYIIDVNFISIGEQFQTEVRIYDPLIVFQDKFLLFSVGKDRREYISLFYFSIYFWHYIFPKDVQRVRAQILGLERYLQRASIQKHAPCW